MSESRIQAQIRAVLSGREAKSRIWRNSVGGAKLEDGSYITYGLGKGSADLIGIYKVLITPDMVGQEIGRFLAVEVKTPIGRLSPEQKAWLKAVQSYGGIAEVCRSETEAQALLKRLG